MNSFYKCGQFWEGKDWVTSISMIVREKGKSWAAPTSAISLLRGPIRKNRVKELRYSYFFLENYIILQDIPKFLLFNRFRSEQRFGWIKNDRGTRFSPRLYRRQSVELASQKKEGARFSRNWDYVTTNLSIEFSIEILIIQAGIWHRKSKL